MLLLSLTLVFPLAALSAVTTISRLQTECRFNTCRVDITANRPVAYHAFNLSHPNRFVIDMKDAYFANVFHEQHFKNTAIKGIRAAYQDHNVLRIVFDLKNNVTVSASPYKKLRFNFVKRKSTVKAKERNIVVLIDPGHGGKDPGASGQRGTREKQVVLEISKKLQQQINLQEGFTAKLTRHGDYYLTLRQRLALARKYKADMFVAIHADAYPDHNASGATIFALSLRGATSEAARWIAKRENASELMGGVELNDKTNLLKSVLLNLSQNATIRASLRIGRQIIAAINHVGHLHYRHVDQAAFVVLKSPDIPSLLIETGFITNPKEELKLKSQPYQLSLAKAITKGIRSYFTHNSPRGTLLAQKHFSETYKTPPLLSSNLSPS